MFTAPFAAYRRLRISAAGSGPAQWFPALAKRIRGVPGDGLPAARILPYFVPRLFGEIAATDMIDDVLDAARALDAHLVVYDPMAFAGQLAAAVLGVLAVRHETSAAFAPDIADLAADALSPLWRTFDLNIRKDRREAAFAICPPSLQEPDPGALTMWPTPLPTAAMQPCQPPLVYLTLGIGVIPHRVRCSSLERDRSHRTRLASSLCAASAGRV